MEYEFDHVFTGQIEAVAEPDPAEMMDWKWIGRQALLNELQQNPERFAVWFRIIAERTLHRLV